MLLFFPLNKLPAAIVLRPSPWYSSKMAVETNAAVISPADSPVKNPSKVKVFSFIDNSSESETLSWEDLGFSVNIKQLKQRKQILKNITGELRPGELTCILGPSGSGKTSFLNLLAGRVRQGGKNSAQITGQVRVNGTPVEPHAFQQLFGYVMQDDALLGTMTPREILKFAAKLRLGEGSANRDELIQDLLESLGLRKCADTMVGNELIKGISGGERKRTAVGAELITNPRITFLDEPTSGLDTGAAYTTIAILQQLTRQSRSVMCTIHQPSSEIFQLFDQAIFIVAGQVVFHGPPAGIRDHFASLNKICPQDYNPADFVMFMTQMGTDEENLSLVEGWTKSPARRPLNPVADKHSLPSIPGRKGFCLELVELSKREVVKTLRDKATLGARFGSTIFLMVLYAIVFFRIGSPDVDDNPFVDRESYDIQSHSGALTTLGIAAMFGSAQPLLLTFSVERPVFMREKASNMYGSSPYFLSKTAVELPLLILQNLVIWLISYWLMGLQGNFVAAWGATTLISMGAASTALMVGCMVSDAKQAMEAAPALFVPQILFAGFFIKMDLIPAFVRWLQYICPLKWGMNLLLLIEFNDVQGGPEMLEANDINEDDWWIYLLVLLVIFVGFRILGMIALSRKAKALYN
mmetsp:Transcript_72914/g.159352  ORF Transcript_72914/g.159352 Transcript_72914/m.159352 type:complete len:638 (-) Transcript_72914:485-2398(-)